MDRYDVNSKLLKDNQEIENRIRSRTSKKGVKIPKNKIGKVTFSGDDRITGTEEQLAEQIINKRIYPQVDYKDIV